MRDTDYAKELATGFIDNAKIERLYVKKNNEKKFDFHGGRMGDS